MNFYVDKYRTLMDMARKCTPKDFGVYICGKKRKMRGGSKRR